MVKSSVKQRACITDWDGTLRSGYTLHDWLSFLGDKSIVTGMGVHEFKIALKHYREGEISYNNLLKQSYAIHARSVCGILESTLLKYTNEFVVKDTGNLFNFTEDLLSELNEKEIKVIVISGGPKMPLQSYRNLLPIDQIFATEIEVDSKGYCSTKVIDRFGDVKSKSMLVSKLKSKYDIVMALGDTSADKPLFAGAEHAFFRRKQPKTRFPSGSIQSQMRELDKSVIKFVKNVL